jgi:molecular chaperone GrpE (heat shock protein)
MLFGRRSTALQQEDSFRAAPPAADLPALDTLSQEVARLRKTILKLGHAQELFQQRIEEEVGRLSRQADLGPGRTPGGGDGDVSSLAGAQPNAAQQRALIEVDQAVLHLLDLSSGSPAQASETNPRSMREGLALLQIRVRNLQRSFGLEPIPALGRLFDDRLHQVYGVCNHSGLADGEVVEEVLPGYRLRDKVVRPALVIVNRHESPE